MHHKVWLEYCDYIHIPQKLTTLSSPAKNTLLNLVAKYKTEADNILQMYNTTILTVEHQRITLGTRISHIFRSYGNYFWSPVTPD